MHIYPHSFLKLHSGGENNEEGGEEDTRGQRQGALAGWKMEG
jgi:hypothetical protein